MLLAVCMLAANPVNGFAQPVTKLPAPKVIPPVIPGQTEAAPPDRHPINLATALKLAGADNLQIALAAEQVAEAEARLQGAQVLWLPTVNLASVTTSMMGGSRTHGVR